MEKLDPLTPLGRQILNEIKERPPEALGAPEAAQPPTPPKIDWEFIRGLAYIPGNEYEEVA